MVATENIHGTKISINIPSDLSFSPKIREFVTSFLKKDSDFSNKWIGRLVLMIDEMVNNAIEHGSDGRNNEVEITLTSFHNKDIKIKIRDNGKKGKSIDAKTLMEKVHLNAQKMKDDIRFNTTVRGRGLCQIVHSWSDEFYYEDNKDGGLTGIIEKKYCDECSRTADLKKEQNETENPSKKTIQIQTLTF